MSETSPPAIRFKDMRSLLLCVAILLLAAPALAVERAPKAAKDAARAYAERHYGADVGLTFTMRSQRDRDWALVDGKRSTRRIWAAWVRRTSTGRWVVRAFRTRNFDPGDRVPCDIRPAYSEPAC